MPGHQRDGVNRVVFMIDTSGSVTYYPGALEAIKVETQAALDEGIIDQATILYGDTRVTRVDEYRQRRRDRVRSAKAAAARKCPRCSSTWPTKSTTQRLIVAFTDLEIEPEVELGPEPHCPVLVGGRWLPWATSRNTSRRRRGARRASKSARTCDH